jgi:hypothetical protein
MKVMTKVMTFEKVDRLEGTERGESGFGSGNVIGGGLMGMGIEILGD